MDRVSDLLRELAAKLGTTMEYLWPRLVAKTRLDYIGSLVVLVVVVIILAAVCRRFLLAFRAKPAKDASGYSGNREVEGTCLTISAIVLTLASILLAICLSQIGTLFYPEATAIERLLCAVGGKR